MSRYTTRRKSVIYVPPPRRNVLYAHRLVSVDKVCDFHPFCVSYEGCKIVCFKTRRQKQNNKYAYAYVCKIMTVVVVMYDCEMARKRFQRWKTLKFFYRNRAYIFLGYVNSLLLILCLFDCIRVRGHNIIIFFNPREECHYIQGSAHNNKLALHMCTRVRETGFFRPTHTRTITLTYTYTHIYSYIQLYISI